MTGLHRSTVSKVITDYLDMGMVTEDGKIEPGQKRVGKKQMLVRIRNEAAWSLGIELRRGRADLTVVGASGAAIQSSSFDFDCPVDEIPVHLSRHIEAWLGKEGAPKGKHAGVGISLRGRVDSAAGHVLHWPEYSLQRYPLVQDWSKCFSAPLFAFDGTHAESACEILNPVKPADENFVYVHLDCRPLSGGLAVSGAESGIVFRGSLYTGAQGNAGRFLGKLNHESPTRLSDHEVKMLEKAGSEITPGMDALASELAELISGTAGLLDVERVILGGHVVPQNSDFLHLVNTRVRRALDAGDGTPTPKVHPGRFRSPTAAHCAGLLAFERSPIGCRI